MPPSVTLVTMPSMVLIGCLASAMEGISSRVAIKVKRRCFIKDAQWLWIIVAQQCCVKYHDASGKAMLTLAPWLTPLCSGPSVSNNLPLRYIQVPRLALRPIQQSSE